MVEGDTDLIDLILLIATVLVGVLILFCAACLAYYFIKKQGRTDPFRLSEAISEAESLVKAMPPDSKMTADTSPHATSNMDEKSIKEEGTQRGMGISGGEQKANEKETEKAGDDNNEEAEDEARGDGDAEKDETGKKGKKEATKRKKEEKKKEREREKKEKEKEKKDKAKKKKAKENKPGDDDERGEEEVKSPPAPQSIQGASPSVQSVAIKRPSKDQMDIRPLNSAGLSKKLKEKILFKKADKSTSQTKIRVYMNKSNTSFHDGASQKQSGLPVHKSSGASTASGLSQFMPMPRIFKTTPRPTVPQPKKLDESSGVKHSPSGISGFGVGNHHQSGS